MYLPCFDGISLSWRLGTSPDYLETVCNIPEVFIVCNVFAFEVNVMWNKTTIH
jgi:hypothetical protein